MSRSTSGTVLERAALKKTGVQPKPRYAARLLWLPVALAVLLACFPVLFARVNENPRLPSAFWGASAALLLFSSFVAWRVIWARRTLQCQVIVNKVHYVQLLMHTCVYTYWGWYWREVYHYIPLIAAQIVFIYALDMLVCWSRRDSWILGFGRFPLS